MRNGNGRRTTLLGGGAGEAGVCGTTTRGGGWVGQTTRGCRTMKLGVGQAAEELLAPPPTRHSRRRRISDALGVPVDIALNMPRMNFEGNARLVLDNHRGLVEYTPSHLQIDTPAGQIDITGKRLRIRGISRDQIVADGWFDRVEFSGWVGNATAGSAGQEAP